MLIKDWMTQGSINLGQDTSIIVAAEIMRRNNVRQLPVVDDKGNLAGIVSDRDVRDALPSKFLPGDGLEPGSETTLASIKAKHVMTLDPVVISPDEPVETAAEALLTNKIGGLPVVDNDNNLVGIITEIDVFRYLCAVTGVTLGGLQMVFELEDTPGAAIELLATLRDQDIRLTSVLTSYAHVRPGFRHVSIRVQSTGRHTLESLVEFLKGKYPLVFYVNDGHAVSVS
ncbi:MAG: CBS domain-containing protein [Deltaproteobacteria bacterium]|nr:CBS domain-containing protein [Deltaproteobacteria bacterium]